jgi:hypothetical protein
MLRHYASSKRVAQIYVNGNTFKDQNQKKVTLNSNYLKQLRLGKPISSVAKPFKTLNNNFNPIQGLQTDGVLLVDDNVSCLHLFL